MRLKTIKKNLSRHWQNLRLDWAAGADNRVAYTLALVHGADPLHDGGRHFALHFLDYRNDNLISSLSPTTLFDTHMQTQLTNAITDEAIERGLTEEDPLFLGRTWKALSKIVFLPTDQSLVYLAERMLETSKLKGVRLCEFSLKETLPKMAIANGAYVDALCRMLVHAAETGDTDSLDVILEKLAPYQKDDSPIKITPEYIDTYPKKFGQPSLISFERPSHVIACAINHLGVTHKETAYLTETLNYKLSSFVRKNEEETIGSLIDAVVYKAPKSLTRDHVLSLVEQGHYNTARRVVKANTLLEKADYTTIMHKVVAQPTPSAPLADLIANVFNRGVDTPTHAETWADMLEKKDFPSIGGPAMCLYLGLAAHIRDTYEELMAEPDTTTPSASEAFALHAEPISKSTKEVKRFLPERFTV